MNVLIWIQRFYSKHFLNHQITIQNAFWNDYLCERTHEIVTFLDMRFIHSHNFEWCLLYSCWSIDHFKKHCWIWCQRQLVRMNYHNRKNHFYKSRSSFRCIKFQKNSNYIAIDDSMTTFIIYRHQTWQYYRR